MSARARPILARLRDRWRSLRENRLALAVAIAAIAFPLFVLLPGFRLASALVENGAALAAASEQRRYPEQIQAKLLALQDRLLVRGYLDDPIDEIRRLYTDFDRQVAGGPEELRRAWVPFRDAITPVAAFREIAYRDSERAGAQLTSDGRRLAEDLRAAIVTSRRSVPELLQVTNRTVEALSARNAELAARQRALMSAGLAFAAVLAGLVGWLLVVRRRQAAAIEAARRQTEAILLTVTEGLFLLDRELTIGSVHSRAMKHLFQREDFAGLDFESLLKGIVSPKTLETALKFVEVLWSERTKENLIRSINPLGEVEILLPAPRGGHETRYLAFEFHRVREGGRITHLLVAVADVSSRVALARELEQSRKQSHSHLDTLMGVLSVEPRQLSTFLDEAHARLRHVNSVLKEPAREDAHFHAKIEKIFREVHAVKGEAAALGVGGILARAHDFEEDLAKLRSESSLSGSDFLPLLIKLDDLFAHIAVLREMMQRLAQARPAEAHPAPAAPSASELELTLRRLAERTAEASGKQVELVCSGLHEVPWRHRRVVKDAVVQLVRNAIVHGIETPGVRGQAGKSATGRVEVRFEDGGASGYRLTVEDDGRGIDARSILETARERGLVDDEDTEQWDLRRAVGVMFSSGFSTQEGPVTHEAGRGVGMSVVVQAVHDADGSIGVATGVGRFARFTISLPRVAPAHPHEATPPLSVMEVRS